MVRALAAVLALTASLTVVGSASAALSTSTANPTNTWAALPYYTCAAAVASDNPYLYWRFDEAAGATAAADSSGNNRPGTYTGGTTLGAARACPRDTGAAVTLNGTTGYIAAGTGVVAVAGPNLFTVEVWFKTAVAGGKLLGFGGSPTGSSKSYDRHLFLNNTGNLVFGVNPGGLKVVVVVSPKTYTDNAWHHAAATLSATGMQLYVDGAQVAADPTTTTAQAFNGYWRAGYDNLTGWGTNTPTNFYFTGSVDDVAVYTTALSPTRIAAHYNAGR